MIDYFRENSIPAVFFGGTLRSLLVSRVASSCFGKPRDVDIVVSGTTADSLREGFADYFTRMTRFGGVKLRRSSWEFDVWPLNQTWALRESNARDLGFDDLPRTTVFNLESVAVDLWPTGSGRKRVVYSGNEQFFEGVIDRTLELNREDNPYPKLCVVRALVMASAIDFKIGPRLANYISLHAEMSEQELGDIQREHYGHVKRQTDLLRRWIEHVVERHDTKPQEPLKLPLERQTVAWAKQGPFTTRLRLLTTE